MYHEMIYFDQFNFLYCRKAFRLNSQIATFLPVDLQDIIMYY